MTFKHSCISNYMPLLAALAGKHPRTITDLTWELRLGYNTVMRMVKRLVDDGCVQEYGVLRKYKARGRHAMHYTLTRRGRHLLKAWHA